MSELANGGERPRHAPGSDPSVTIFVPRYLSEEIDLTEWTNQVALRAFVRMGDRNARDYSPVRDHGC